MSAGEELFFLVTLLANDKVGSVLFDGALRVFIRNFKWLTAMKYCIFLNVHFRHHIIAFVLRSSPSFFRAT